MSIHLQLERPHPADWRVTFDRPPINAITADTVAELSELVDMIEHDDDPTGARPSRAVTSSHQCIPVGPSGIDRGVVGLIIGILGGPLGVLLGGATVARTGATQRRRESGGACAPAVMPVDCIAGER